MDDRRVRWLTDLVRLEIELWEHVDARLKRVHGLPLASYEALDVLARGVAFPVAFRVGDLAREMRITVGGASKLAERVRAAGLIERAPDPGDRRASLIALTAAGRAVWTAATVTYEAAVAERLDGVLTDAEQQQMHDLVTRILSTGGVQQSHS
ncbi:MarR family winged helix-turn-helix transcriptional regulator [Actinoplanes bogorensis]|uniref:MarR family winged helix-turn-helix transcriptional regulator n=1 Tax=Paractinoplanes bogorensis TaxID=1610840 RepID=A0ABS5YLY2_9ACTN|nr:MarR family winged helix-turn-helix transcriptional regulator [Actinoplanes bogorensis]MBU2664447.1 MarR family winged helix-turn-helix transcriptional regulator [Actinoplanes bogorensis]